MTVFNRQRRRPVIGSDSMQRRHRPDYTLLVISALLLVIGLVLVFSISPALGAQKNVSESYFVNKQVIAIIFGAFVFALTSSMSPKSWRVLEMPLLILAATSALAVRLLGEEVNGAYRWIQLGGLSFQAAELIKFALVVWLAGFLADRKRRGVLDSWKDTFRPLSIALLIIGIVVVVVQSDLGSAAVMIAIMGMMSFVAGLPLKRVILASGVVLLVVSLGIITSPYRRDRVQTFLQPTSDCQGTGYQSCQALIAVGSGGIVGLGLGQSVQAYGYLPEAGNDSIFAIYAEKFGFIGSATLIALLAALFIRMMKIIDRAPDDYTKFLAVGILAWLSTQTIINIGAMIGLLPLKGITLPFISYGGTSLIFVAAAVGVVFSISRYTSYNANNTKKGITNENSTGGRWERRTHNAPISRRP